MKNQLFNAMVVRETPDNKYIREIKEKNLSELPDNEVLVAVRYSSLNYKDALSASGNRAVTRRYPHTPGIDAAGIIEESASELFRSGDEVIVTDYDLGTRISGGFGQYIRVPADWIVPLPDGLSLYESMIYGTAGFTAAQSVEKIVSHGVGVDDGKILVTGATGGVGSVAVALLARLGYEIVAVTNKLEEHPLLRELGAREIMARDKAVDRSGKMLLREKWAAVVDTVGGDILATAVKSTRYGGIVTCCGNVASAELNLSVYPFILRGVSLCGIDSAQCPLALRKRIWGKLAGEWKLAALPKLATDIRLSQLNEYIEKILQGKNKGRIVVHLTENYS